MEKRYKHLTLEDRCTIARLHADGQSIRKIAATMDRSASTITREIRRNSGNKIGYKPAYADEQSWARRWRGCRLMRQPDLQNHVLSHLAMGWSPEQISGRLTQENNTMRISHESIYRFIYAQITRTGDYSWRHYLPRAKSKRGHVRRPYKSMKHIKDRVSIADRPLYINKRCQIGHWETDLLMLSDKKHNLLVAQERHTRFTLIAKQDGKFAQPTLDRLKEWLSPLPAGLRRSLTQDNGPEFFEHHQLNQLGIKTYFCDPRSPWQKGGIENMNGRIRRYIPLKTKPDSFSDNDLRLLASHLNNTPRKCLGYKTPNELFLPQLNPLHFKCESTFWLSPE